MQWPGRVFEIEESCFPHFFGFQHQVSGPASGRETQGEAVGQIPFRVCKDVNVWIREGTEGDKICCFHAKSRFFRKLLYGGPNKGASFFA
jgi:hypothetical protein